MTAPVAYIRRSARAQKGSDGEVSLAAQESAVRELAHRDGHSGDLQLFTDAGRSGDEAKVGKRSEYAKMLTMIERGEVSVLYAYALDRLHRSVISTTRLVQAAEQYGVRIVTQREGEVRQDSPDEWLRWTILSTFGEYELRIAKARAESRDKVRRERGDYLGVVPYGWYRKGGKLAPNPQEPLQPLVEAYRATGSFLAAARKLNKGGVPARRERWSDTTLARILRREGLIPASDKGGSRYAPVDHYLARLLRCPHDGSLLTGQRKHGRAERTVYFCQHGRRDADHPRPYAVAESKLLDWVKEQAARFTPPGEVEQAAADEQRTALEERRERLGWAVTDGLLSREQAVEQATAIDAELDGLSAVRQAVDVPQAIDWERWDRGAVNAVLLALWRGVVLGSDLLPDHVEWAVPEEWYTKA